MAIVKVRDWKPGEITRMESSEITLEDASIRDLFAAFVEGARKKFGDRLITVELRAQIDCQIVVGAVSLPPLSQGEIER